MKMVVRPPPAGFPTIWSFFSLSPLSLSFFSLYWFSRIWDIQKVVSLPFSVTRRIFRQRFWKGFYIFFLTRLLVIFLKRLEGIFDISRMGRIWNGAVSCLAYGPNNPTTFWIFYWAFWPNDVIYYYYIFTKVFLVIKLWKKRDAGHCI